jgi:hypothetical protein
MISSEIPPELLSVPAVKRYIKQQEKNNGKQKSETNDDQ